MKKRIKSARGRGMLAVSGLGVVVVAAACTTSMSASTSGSSSPSACATGPRSFTRSRLQIADLSEFMCDDPAVMDQARAKLATRQVIDRLGTRPDFSPDVAPTWTYPTPQPAGEPVTGTPAYYFASYPTPSNSDEVIFGYENSTGPQILAINDLYTTPALVWSATLGGGGMDGSWIEFDNHQNVYVEDTSGTLWCFAPTTGGTCSSWLHAKYPASGSSNGSQYTSPWWSYDEAAIYFADSAGNLTKVKQSTGGLVWTINLSNYTPMNSSGTQTACPGGCNNFAVRGSPIEYAGHIYIGNDGGAYFNITDPGTSTPTASNVQATWLCGTPVGTSGCNSGSGSAWSVVNASSLDVNEGTSGYLYAAVAGEVFEWQIGSTNWYHPNSVTFLGSATLPVFSSPVLDRTNHNVYLGYNNSLYKVTYPLNGSVSSVALQGQGSNASYPHGTPLVYSPSVFLGDGAGKVENYGCMALANPQAPQLVGLTASYGSSIDSSPVSDIISSESGIDFGFTNGTGGGVAQIASSVLNSCPGGLSCSGGCGGATICIAGGGCCTSANCPTPPTNGSYACTNNQCVESCTSGTLCAERNACIPAGQCCTNADCTSPATCDVSNGVCITPADTVTLNLNYPVNATLTTVSGTVVAPTTTLSTGSVSVTQGGTTVTGSGTSFTTTYTQSMSAVNVTSGGSGYASPPTVSFTGGCTTEPSATASLGVGVTVVTGGSGYTSAPTVSFTAGSGGCTTEPAAVASLTSGAVSSVTVWYPGIGCTSAPTATLSGGGFTIAATVTTAFTGSVAAVTVTNGGAGCTSSPTVGFSSGTASASAATGLSFSIDDSNWYEVASVNSGTQLTLATAFLGDAETGVAPYYESDCNVATQNCNQTYPFTISNLTSTPTCGGAATCSGSAPTCNSVTCNIQATIGLAQGAFSFSATGTDSLGRTEASAILENGLYVLAPTTTTAYLNMIRSYPIGPSNGVAATCPLQLGEDSNGNIWTVNSKGENSTNVCSGLGAVSNNISELVQSATPPYAPTVIPNTVWGSGGSAGAAPEFIVGDSSGDVWFTVPETENGIFEIANSNVTTTRTQYAAGGANCYNARGIDIDPSTSTNGVFVACGGQSANLPDGARNIIRMDGNGNQIAFFDLEDYGAQPVSLVYARAYTPGSNLLMNTDYHGNTEVYINRQSSSQSLITTLEWSLAESELYYPCTNVDDSTYTVTSSNGNLYGMSYDSGGTPYAAAVNNGEVLNVEFYETQNGEAPLTNGVAVACNGNGAGASNYSMNLDSSETGNFASPTPWSTANDDLFTYPIQNINGNEVMVAGTNLYASHYTTNRVTRFSDGEIALNDYIVGATNAPAPTGLLFDRTHGVIWVANSNESSLTQINKNLLLYTNETNTGPTCCGYGAWGGSASPGAGAACFATVPAGTNTASIVGYGFDTSLSNGSNNTVLIAGYMAQTTGVALSGVPDGVVGFTVTSGGSGYTTAPNATLSGNCSTEPTAQPTIAGTMNVAVTAGGSGYTSVPVVSFTAGCTQEPAATVTVSGGAVTGVTVSNNGGGCTTGPNVVFTGGGGSGATATATISSGVVDGIRMQAFGSGCVNGAAPSVTLSGSGGAAASSYFVDPVQTTLTINVPRAPHGITGPVIVANQGGQIISYCTYTTQ